MEQFYLERLCEPHLQLSDTFQLLSSFVSTYKNASYEESLVKSQPIYNATKSLVDLREPQEDQLAAAHYSAEAFQAYLAWEQEVTRPNFLLVKILYERALAAHPTNAEFLNSFLAVSVRSLNCYKPPARRHGNADQLHLALKTSAVKKPQSLSGVTESGWTAERLLELYQRAVRYLPFSGEAISECIRGTVSTCLGSILSGRVNKLISIFLSRNRYVLPIRPWPSVKVSFKISTALKMP